MHGFASNSMRVFPSEGILHCLCRDPSLVHRGALSHLCSNHKEPARPDKHFAGALRTQRCVNNVLRIHSSSGFVRPAPPPL